MAFHIPLILCKCGNELDVACGRRMGCSLDNVNVHWLTSDACGFGLSIEYRPETRYVV